GESMFARHPDASKIAFVALADHLARRGFRLIDCQQSTPHLRRFGAFELEREAFLARLHAGVREPWRLGPWSFEGAVAGASARGGVPRADPGAPAPFLTPGSPAASTPDANRKTQK